MVDGEIDATAVLIAFHNSFFNVIGLPRAYIVHLLIAGRFSMGFKSGEAGGKFISRRSRYSIGVRRALVTFQSAMAYYFAWRQISGGEAVEHLQTKDEARPTKSRNMWQKISSHPQEFKQYQLSCYQRFLPKS